MSTITATDVGFAVDGARLLDRIDLQLEPGRLVALVGPNGAGKTTLLRLLAGELAPTSGTVEMGDQALIDLHPSDLALVRAYLQRSPESDIPFTSRTLVGLGRHPHRQDPDNSAARDAGIVEGWMRATDTLSFADRPYRTLSGGEQMRVSIARVLSQDTPVVLLDEPTAALDLSHQERMLDQLSRHAATGRIVVVVVHDLNAAAAHADEIVVMSEGRIAAHGEPTRALDEQLLTRVYRHQMRVISHPLRGGPLVLTGDVLEREPGEP